MKNWNLHSNLSNPKKITKKINVQSKVNFTKDSTSNIPNSIYSKKTIIMDFFLLVELEIKGCNHGNMYHNKCNQCLMFHVIENVI
jgi:hypothetical protein